LYSSTDDKNFTALNAAGAGTVYTVVEETAEEELDS
jgi:hypothetical protein